MLVTRRTATRRHPPSYWDSYPSYVTPIQATATAMAVLTTALIGAKVDLLLAELIGDVIAGIRTLNPYARAACQGIRIRRREAQQRKRKATHGHARGLTAEEYRWKLIREWCED